MSMFAPPAPPQGGIDFKENLGRLMIIEPLSVKENITTAYGLTTAVEANVTVLDTPSGVVEYPQTLIFPKVLQSQLRTSIGKKVLGRLGQGVAKPGQQPPWNLLEASSEDMTTASAYIQAKQAPVAPTNVGVTAKAPF